MKRMREITVFLSNRQTPGSFQEALQKFISKRHRKGLSDYSVIHLYNSLYPMGLELKNPQMTDLTPQKVKGYVDRLWLKYAPGTMRPIIGDLKQFLAWCKKKGYTGKNLGSRLTKPRPRRITSKAAREADVAAVMSLLAGLLTHRVYRDLFGNLVHDAAANWSEAEILAIRDLFAVVFLYETGGRARELTQLGTKVMERACQTPAAAYTVTSIGKTNDRDLRFTDNTAELWRIWSAVRPHECDYALYSLRPTHPAGPLTSNGLSQILVRRCNEAGVPVFRSHALRHAKVRRARRLVGLEIASLLIDHSSVEMTRNYANVDDGELSEAVVKTGLQRDIWHKKDGEKL